MDAASTNELTAAHKRRRQETEAEVAQERGVVGIGDGSGRTWHGGPPNNDHMWVRVGAGFEADGVTPTTPHLARNLSLHEFVEGDPVTLEWMSSARGANMLQIVYRELAPIVAPTSWTGTFAYTHEVVVDPPSFDSVPSFSASGTSSSTFVVSLGTVSSIGPYGRNSANRPMARNVLWTRTRFAQATGTPAFIIATFGYFAASALAPVSDTVSGVTAAPIDAPGVTTAAYQNHGNGYIEFDDMSVEMWVPEAHTGVESDGDYLASCELADLIY